MKYVKASCLPIIAFLIVITSNDAFACTCVPVANPFLKVAPKSVLVIRGNILRHTGEGETKTEMDVEVLETLAGETSEKVINVSGDSGNQCRSYVSRFPVGTEWILALEPATKGASEVDAYMLPGPDKGDYAISNCGAYWLEVKDGKAKGNIDIDNYDRRHESQEIRLEKLRRRFAIAKKSVHTSSVQML